MEIKFDLPARICSAAAPQQLAPVDDDPCLHLDCRIGVEGELLRGQLDLAIAKGMVIPCSIPTVCRPAEISCATPPQRE